MTFETPRLDDRAFSDIVEEARQRIALYCPEWTDHNVSDPGMALIELFAWMTDIVLYRLNRVPEKHLIRFMELVGMQREVSSAASARVLFWLKQPRQNTITIKAGTQVATTRTEQEEAIIFTTLTDEYIYNPDLEVLFSTTIPPGQDRRVPSNNFIEASREEKEGYRAFRSDVSFFTADVPNVEDALYFGFKKNVSHHVLGLRMDLVEKEGASVQPDNPPITWEALALVDANDPNELPTRTWVPLTVEQDTTLGLNQSGLVQLYLPEMDQQDRNGFQAFWIRCRLSHPSDLNRYDVSPKIERIKIEGWGRSVLTQNYTMIENEVLGRSDGTPGQRFFLRHTPVVKIRDRHAVLDHTGAGESQELIVKMANGEGDEERWELRDHFADSTRHDNHYTLDPNTGEIRFGPALPGPDGNVKSFGRIPPKGAMIIFNAYQYGGGVKGNVSEYTINILKTAIPYIDRVENRQPAINGRDAETLEHAMMRFQNHMRSIDRAVTAQDFEYLAKKAVSNIGRVKCMMSNLPEERGLVRLFVIPNVINHKQQLAHSSLQLPTETIQEIHSYLDTRRLLGTRLEVRQPNYRWISTRIRVYISTRIRTEVMRQNITEALYRFINPLIGGIRKTGWPLGQDISNDDISGMIRNIPGVERVDMVQLNEVYVSDDGSSAQASNQVLNPIVLDSTDVVVSFEHEVIVEYEKS